MEKKNLICINCPMGCRIEVTEEGGKLKVTGNSCKRGELYAISEITNPVRIVTTSLFVNDGVHPTVSVKTSREIPKKMIFKCMEKLSAITVDAPVKIGDVIVKDILNTGADIVATRNVDLRLAI
ncbi:MAG TPA: molybdopterin oxidoreductase [Clostridiaceae bacterium]|nr:molybdopterin oxidoreductase [Clostridiaceae bacterium]